ncbi:hypothetical protein C5167_004827 [Papaver somniferum]|uniref:Uncharacterized protein n=2 Tax=Papaver somniferum TaxID=3469 RepID=A0A4Y7JAJ2_PAPSO|nr:hypothetical protein C5167_004827 [Papaver somniferum]
MEQLMSISSFIQDILEDGVIFASHETSSKHPSPCANQIGRSVRARREIDSQVDNIETDIDCLDSTMTEDPSPPTLGIPPTHDVGMNQDVFIGNTTEISSLENASTTHQSPGSGDSRVEETRRDEAHPSTVAESPIAGLDFVDPSANLGSN